VKAVAIQLSPMVNCPTPKHQPSPSAPLSRRKLASMPASTAKAMTISGMKPNG